MKIHINIPSGYYIGQVRRIGCRNYRTVTGKCKSPERAMQKALDHMHNMKRARVLFIDDSGWYEPNVVMELNT